MKEIIAKESIKMVAKHYAEKIKASNPNASEAEIAEAVSNNWAQIASEIAKLYALSMEVAA